MTEASAELKADIEFLLAAVSQSTTLAQTTSSIGVEGSNIQGQWRVHDGKSIKYKQHYYNRSDAEKARKDIAAGILRHTAAGTAMFHAGTDTLKSSTELVTAVAAKLGWTYVLQDATEGLRSNREVMLLAMLDPEVGPIRAVECASEKLTGDITFMHLSLLAVGSTSHPQSIQSRAIKSLERRGIPKHEALKTVQQHQSLPLLLKDLNGGEHPVTGWIRDRNWAALAKVQHEDLCDHDGSFEIVTGTDEVAATDEHVIALLAGPDQPSAILVWGDTVVVPAPEKAAGVLSGGDGTAPAAAAKEPEKGLVCKHGFGLFD